MNRMSLRPLDFIRISQMALKQAGNSVLKKTTNHYAEIGMVAAKRASEKAYKEAIASGTPLPFWRDG